MADEQRMRREYGGTMPVASSFHATSLTIYRRSPVPNGHAIATMMTAIILEPSSDSI